MSAIARGFQERTVKHVAKQLRDPGTRFLVADEAGLGKTVIARDVIKSLLAGTRRRFLVLYLCSNADIAKQNKSRLLDGLNTAIVPLASRLTLLPIERGQGDSPGLDLIALTAGTSLDFRSGRGSARERRLIHSLLIQLKFRRAHSYSAARLLAPMAHDEPPDWLRRVRAPGVSDRAGEWLSGAGVKEGLQKQWNDLRGEFTELLRLTKRRPKLENWTKEDKKRASQLVGKLREGLAHVVIDTLNPELIIMDEFQNFADLLLKENAGEALAHKLLERKSRLLLLSATPYRAYTSDFSFKNEKHSEQFEAVIKFLYKDVAVVDRLRTLFRSHHAALEDGALKGDKARQDAALRAKNEIQDILCRVISRTERHDVEGAEQSLVKDTGPEPWMESRDRVLSEPLAGLDPEPQDLRARRWLEEITAPEFRHFCPAVSKDIPFPFNFMAPDAYKFIHGLKRKGGVVPCGVKEEERKGFLLESHDLSSVDFRKEAASGKLRSLLNLLANSQWGKHLWIPPSKAYYRTLSDAGSEHFPRKFLVFSRWKALPHALSIITSQFAEGIWGKGALENPFRFVYPSRRADPKITHVSTLLLFHPSHALASLVDPLEEAGEASTLADLRRRVRARLLKELGHVRVTIGKRRAGESSEVFQALWRLESDEFRSLYQETTRRRGNYLPATEDGDWPGGIIRYVRGVANKHPHGNAYLRISEEELDSLVLLAIGGPGVCLMRSMLRFGAFKSGINHRESADVRLLGRILRVSHGNLRRFFNSPAVGATVRSGLSASGRPREAWAQVLSYSVERHWQAVLDEFCSCLSEEVSARSAANRALAILESLEVRFRVPLGRPQFRVYREGAPEKKADTRRHIAQAFGDEKASGKERSANAGGDLLRDHVRQAFNSPFWPFVLVTTSVGQEGLDFHRYCRDVVHWNLPARAPAFEQREGRLQRYLSLAVRQAISEDFPAWREVLGHVRSIREDPWRILVNAAEHRLSKEARLDGLAPYWIYRGQASTSTVRRWVLAHPFSREAVEYRRLRESVLMYRLLLGASQQEDTLKAVRRSIPDHILRDDLQLKKLLRDYWIDLRPPGGKKNLSVG